MEKYGGKKEDVMLWESTKNYIYDRDFKVLYSLKINGMPFSSDFFPAIFPYLYY